MILPFRIYRFPLSISLPLYQTPRKIQHHLSPFSPLKNGSCVFTITQDICVAVPVEFGAVATVGDTYVSCNEVSDNDICTGCDQMPPVTPEIPQV